MCWFKWHCSVQYNHNYHRHINDHETRFILYHWSVTWVSTKKVHAINGLVWEAIINIIPYNWLFLCKFYFCEKCKQVSIHNQKYSHNNHLTHGYALTPHACGTWERRTMSIFKPVLPLPLPEDTRLSIHATHETNAFIQQTSEEPTPSKKRKLSTPMISDDICDNKSIIKQVQ